MKLTKKVDGVPTDCVVNFDDLRTLRRETFRRQIVMLSPKVLAEVCQRLSDATGC